MRSASAAVQPFTPETHSQRVSAHSRELEHVQEHLVEVVMKCVEQKEQQLLRVLLGVIVELGEDGAQR